MKNNKKENNIKKKGSLHKNNIHSGRYDLNGSVATIKLASKNPLIY